MDLSPPDRARRERPIARHYGWGEVAVVLATFALCGLLFDSGGLRTWAQRQDVGPVQTAWLYALTPLHRALAAAHLAAPRAALVATADAWSARWATPAQEVPRAAPAARATVPRLPLAAPHPDVVVLPASLRAVRALEPPAGPRTLLLVGDSMMEIGLGPGIAQAFASSTDVKVVSESHLGTGLSRPDVFDWPFEAAKLTARTRPAWVVASFGANDAQDLRQGTQVIPFGSSAWDADYQGRVHSFMKELTHGGAKLLWVSLPPMRESGFHTRAQKLNDLAAAAARGVPGVSFLDATAALTRPDRAFTTYLPTPGGGLIQVRQADGVHMSTAGGLRVAAVAVAWVTSQVEPGSTPPARRADPRATR